jgi:hypothetical protein
MVHTSCGCSQFRPLAESFEEKKQAEKPECNHRGNRRPRRKKGVKRIFPCLPVLFFAFSLFKKLLSSFVGNSSSLYQHRIARKKVNHGDTGQRSTRWHFFSAAC